MNKNKLRRSWTHEQKQVEKVVTHEQEKVEKIVKRSRRVDGVLWRHRSHVAKTSISHASVKHGKAIPPCHAQHAQTLLHR